MKHTEGIVLQKTDYSETSLIVKILTQDTGIQSFIFQGAKRQKKKGNLVSPMAILSIDYSLRNDSDLGKIRSVEPALVYKQIPFDPYRSGVLFFMNEVMNKVVKEKSVDEELYTFLRSILEVLDLSDNISNLPIKFLYLLTKQLGFYPELNPKLKEDGRKLFFDLQEGKYTPHQPNHPYYLSPEKTTYLLALSNTTFDGKNDPDISLSMRRKLINDLLNYYRIIFDHFGDVQSLAVLESTYHD